MKINSGATSHFITEDMNLPKGQKSNKQVYLPDNTTRRTSTKTKLPFPNLSEAAQEADILPGLKRSLMSVNKMAQEGCTTIFHPGEKGVTIQEKGSLQIIMTKAPVLHGHKINGDKLWTVSGQIEMNKQEEASNV